MSTISATNDMFVHPGITVFTYPDSRPVSIPLSAQSHAGFRSWALSEDFPDRGHITFISGELIVDMSPEYLETHNAIKSDVSAAVYSFVKRSQLGIFFSDRFMLTNEEAEISTEPDAMFACYESFETNRCRIVDSPRPGVAQELVGSPDWVLEIVSDTSMRKDKKLLRERYFKAGIGEYWLVDALGEELSFQILVPGDKSYMPVVPSDGWLTSPTFGFTCRLTCETDNHGFIQYTLHLREP
jgi:Uma2 family endonuclease